MFFVSLAAAAQERELFRDMDWREGEICKPIHVRLTDIMMYEPRGENDTTTHRFPSTALAFTYKGEEYSIPVSDRLEWGYDDIALHDSVRLVLCIRDQRGFRNEYPYAEVVAMERIHVPGEVDTIGRFVCYNGDTIYITNKEANWGIQPIMISERCWGLLDEVVYIQVLHLHDEFCRTMRSRFVKYVDYYDRGNRMWTVRYYRIRDSFKVHNAPVELDIDPCTIYLKEQEY